MIEVRRVNQNNFEQRIHCSKANIIAIESTVIYFFLYCMQYKCNGLTNRKRQPSTGSKNDNI